MAVNWAARTAGTMVVRSAAPRADSRVGTKELTTAGLRAVEKDSRSAALWAHR
jgi:hypothetical protein